MAEFSIDGVAFRSNKIDAMTQFGIVCKFGAVLDQIKPAIMAIAQHSAARKMAEAAGETPPEMDLDAIIPLGKALSGLPDQSRDYIVEAILRATFRQQGPGFQPTWDAMTARPIPEVDFPVLARILAYVLKDNVGNFFPALG